MWHGLVVIVRCDARDTMRKFHGELMEMVGAERERERSGQQGGERVCWWGISLGIRNRWARLK